MAIKDFVQGGIYRFNVDYDASYLPITSVSDGILLCELPPLDVRRKGMRKDNTLIYLGKHSIKNAEFTDSPTWNAFIFLFEGMIVSVYHELIMKKVKLIDVVDRIG